MTDHYLKNDSVDLIVTSPPYYKARDYGGSDESIGRPEQNLDGYLKDMEQVFKACYNVLKDGRYMILNISPVIDPEIGRVNLPALLSLLMEEVGFHFCEDIMWVKPDGAAALRVGPFIQNSGRPRTYYPNIVTEYIYVMLKGEAPKTNPDGKWERFKYDKHRRKDIRTLDDYSKKGSEKEEGRVEYYERWLLTNVWYFNCVQAKNVGHPAPFPPTLPRLCIKLFSYEGETVLDPFAGSGTTLKQAQLLGRNALGIELEKKNVELIKKTIGYGVHSLLENDTDREYRVREELEEE